MPHDLDRRSIAWRYGLAVLTVAVALLVTLASGQFGLTNRSAAFLAAILLTGWYAGPGPVVVAIPFDTEDDAIAIANDSDFGLAGAVWTGDIGKAYRVAAQVKAGTFWINMYKVINVASPFGGYDASGYGRSSGIEALHEYTQVKSVWVETALKPNQPFGYAPSLDK